MWKLAVDEARRMLLSGSARLSVVIPTHNRPEMVKEAVASALAACSDLDEVIVVDDGSTQPAARVLADISSADPRVRIISNPGPRGAAGARNAGVAAARGEIVMFLDDDDWMLQGYPESAHAAAKSSGSPVFGFCATLSESTDVLVSGACRRATSGFLPKESRLRRRLVAFSAGFWISRALYIDLGGCDPVQRIDEDTEFCCRIASRGLRPWYISKPGVRIRMAPEHSNRLTRSTPTKEILACYRRTWQRHEGSFPDWSEARWYLATRFVRRAIREGLPEEAVAILTTVRPQTFRFALWMFYVAKRISQSLRSLKNMEALPDA